MTIDVVLRDLHTNENALILELLRLSERYASVHEVHHLARDVARWSRAHVRKLAELGPDYGVELDPEPKNEHALGKTAREKISDVEAGRGLSMTLLADLRTVYLRAAELSVDWEMLAQAAQAARDERLLGLASECHPSTLRQMRWANATIKSESPQIILSA